MMLNRWLDLLAAWGVNATCAREAYEDVRQQYASAGRYYHTFEHVRSVLDVVEQISPYAQHPNAVRLAAWLHDVVYDPRVSDNEERSAQYAERLCNVFSIPEGGRVASLILTTKAHDAGDDADSQVLIDADLAILGAADDDYRTYAGNIRREYVWVPDQDYRTGRRRVLEEFLSKPKIFRFLTQLEQRARQNIAFEIAELS